MNSAFSACNVKYALKKYQDIEKDPTRKRKYTGWTWYLKTFRDGIKARDPQQVKLFNRALGRAEDTPMTVDRKRGDIFSAARVIYFNFSPSQKAQLEAAAKQVEGYATRKRVTETKMDLNDLNFEGLLTSLREAKELREQEAKAVESDEKQLVVSTPDGFDDLNDGFTDEAEQDSEDDDKVPELDREVSPPASPKGVKKGRQRSFSSFKRKSDKASSRTIAEKSGTFGGQDPAMQRAAEERKRRS